MSATDINASVSRNASNATPLSDRLSRRLSRCLFRIIARPGRTEHVVYSAQFRISRGDDSPVALLSQRVDRDASQVVLSNQFIKRFRIAALIAEKFVERVAY